MNESIDVHKVFAMYFPGIEAWAYAVSDALEEGSICLDIATYQKELAENIEQNAFVPNGEQINVHDLKNSVYVTENPEDKLTPFVLKEAKLYMQRYWVYQKKIVKKIDALIESESQVIADRKTALNKDFDFIQILFPYNKRLNETQLTTIEKIDWQKVAALNSCLHNFSIITGGPGTGKTTTVAKILAILYHQKPELKVALAAPTGKAAVRMSESLNQAKDTIPGLTDEIRKRYNSIVPKTIHRLLENLPKSTLFRHNAENPLEYDLIIIDEASMIDGALMYKLLEAIRPESRIIFLGDKNQLASVEAGSLFGDICRTQGDLINHLRKDKFDFCNQYLNQDNKIPENHLLKNEDGNILSEHIIQLYRNYRTESYEIFSLCKLIIENKADELIEFVKSNDTTTNIYHEKVIIFDETYEQLALNEIAIGYCDYIKKDTVSQALKLLNKCRVLCAVREGKHGVYQLNKNIERLLKVTVNDISRFNPSNTFYHNQAIMVTKNNYELGVFNGDTGIIRRKSDTDDGLIAYFESDDPEQPKEILPGYLSDYETVYAMTIHKSQGSEFDQVAVILPESENTGILTRELLYTAVSRAKKKVLIQSPGNVLLATISREVSRASGICDQF